MSKMICEKCCFVNNDKCVLLNMNQNQLNYIFSSSKQNIFLSACPGSGKTEVLGMKMLYELNNWKSSNSGIALLTFTNSAEKELEDRVNKYCKSKIKYPHFVGTFTSWLHQYIANPFIANFVNYRGQSGDKSLRLIDSGMHYDFLNSFCTQYSYSNLYHIGAQDYYCDLKNNKYKYYKNDNNSLKFENILASDNHIREDLKRLKIRFWKAGLFLYEDIEYLVYKFLKKYEDICKYVAKRFPLIFIDECQDLSFVELEILALLEKSGSRQHFIGDLNQSIYSFRNIEPSDIEKFTIDKGFDKFVLNENYRSCQQIVNISEFVINDANKIISKENQRLDIPLVIFLIKKEDFQQPIEMFYKMIEENGLAVSQSRIIVRNNSLKNKILGCKKESNTINTFEEIAHAIYLRKNQKNIDDLKESFNHMCLALQRIYFKDKKHLGTSNYFKPEDIENTTWKRIVAHYLDQLFSYPKVLNFDLTWSEWTKNLKQFFLKIRESLDFKLEEEKFGKIRNGKPNEKVLKMFNNLTNSKIKIETIHGCKGMTLDAALVVSSYRKNNSDSAVYWKQWFSTQNISENNRMAYVAFSRPKHLLGLVIPRNSDFTEDDYKFLSSKFKIIEI